MSHSADPRYAELEPEFKRIIADLTRYMASIAELRQGRATHTSGLTLRGTMHVRPDPELPAHPFFAAGRDLTITLRHASFKGFADDAVLDGRSASLRVLPTADADVAEGGSLLDLILSNGRTFVLGDAVIFHRWFTANLSQRAEILKEYAPFTPSFQEFVRSPDSFTALHYYSQITYHWLGGAGGRQLARFRLLRADRPADSGFVDPALLQLPLDYVPRLPGDSRPTTYLRDELRQRIAGGGIEYLLQVQLRPLPADEAEYRRAVDPTAAWAEAAAPLRDLARLRLDELLPEPEAARQHLNVATVPESLPLPYVTSARHPAAIAQLRSIVYDGAAAARLGRPLPAALQAILSEFPAATRPADPSAAPSGEPLQSADLYRDLSPDFEQTIATVGHELTRIAAALGRLPNLATGSTLLGELEVLPTPTLPAHPFFASGRRYPVVIRHNSERGFADDAVWDGRQVMMRVLDPALLDAPPEQRGTASRGLMDLILYTGSRYLFANAQQMGRWLPAPFPVRAQLLGELPELAERLHDFIRDPDSFTALYYYSHLAYGFFSADGQRQLVRYRLRSVEAQHDSGWVERDKLQLPLDYVPRQPDDTRPSNYLHADLARRAAQGLHYRLELQLRSWPQRADAEALDSSRIWDEERFPFIEVARIHLTSLLPSSVPVRRDFRPESMPADLPLLRARSSRDPASVGHLFAIVNDLQLRLQQGLPPAPQMQALIERYHGPQPAARAVPVGRRVVVIGGGAAGLSAAHELEKRGHRVTVLERADTIGGKSAAFDVDGHSFDLGTHICTGQYHRVKQLAAEIGCPTELLTPLLSFDLEKRALFAPGVSFMSEMPAYSRLIELYTKEFPKIHLPGLHHEAQKLAQPIDQWLREHGLVDLLRATGIDIGYASSGYGYLDSPEYAMLYLMKMIDLSGFVDPTPQQDYQGEWTIAGCFMNLWRRLALALGDVRCGVEVQRVERRPDKVVITTRTEVLECDDVVLALPLEKSLQFLDASAEERDLLGRIRHNLYFTTVAAATGLPREGFYMVAQNSLDSRLVGRCTAFHHRYADSDVYTFYAYGGPGVDGAAVLRQLAQDVRQMGGQLGTIYTQQPWDYFPYVTPDDIRAGFFERMEALQGQSRTYYVGSLLGYELVECTVAYSQNLIEQRFAHIESAELAEKRTRMSALGAEEAAGRARPPRQPRQTDEIRAWLVEHLSQELKLPVERISPSAALESFGLDSVVANSLVGQFSDWLGFRITPAIIVEYPTIDAVARHLSESTR